MQLTEWNICVCEMSGEVFRLSCKKGYDSRKFITSLMNSEEGQYLYSNYCLNAWLGVNYVMQGIEAEIHPEKGEVINDELMFWIGYLFRCWSLTYEEDTAKDIITQAPLDLLFMSYQGFHVMPFEDVILELKDIYKENQLL